MKIKITSVFVSDQAKALKFYTEVLGFEKKNDVSAGEYRWLTVASPEQLNGVELLLEPNDNPAAKTFQKAIFKQGIPATSFFVDDMQQEYEKLKKSGAKFTMQPIKVTGSTIAMFDDTCGNLIQINQLD
jgi:predicted enzyme related to lactoylglutathione lyase